jgi:excisionase family DNA binding protein
MQTHDAPAHALLTPPEAAAFLRLSLTTLYRLVQGGRIPHLRASRSLRFERAELMAWARGPCPKI